MRELREKQAESIAWAKDVGITQMITATLGGGNTPTMDDVKKAADEYNKIAAVAAKAGIQQGLHNEGFEVSMVDGKRTYDVLFELLDPKLVKFQFQMSTISQGFVAHEYFTKYPGRFFSMHVQDVDLKAARRRLPSPVRRPRGARRPGTRPGSAGAGWKGQHRLGQDLPGGEGRRRQELLRRAEHGAHEGKRRRAEGDEGLTPAGTGIPNAKADDSISGWCCQRARWRGVPVPSIVDATSPGQPAKVADVVIRIDTRMDPPRWASARAAAPGRQRAGLPGVLQQVLRRPRLPAVLRALGRQRRAGRCVRELQPLARAARAGRRRRNPPDVLARVTRA